MKIANSSGKPEGGLGMWVKIKKVLKVVIEVVGFVAAIKTIFS